MSPRARSVFKGWSYKSTQLTGPFQHCMFPLSHCLYPQSSETAHTGFLCRNLEDYCNVRQQISKITASLSDSSQTRTVTQTTKSQVKHQQENMTHGIHCK